MHKINLKLAFLFRRKMKSYFDGITVLGLPDLDIPAGESLGYQHLTQRFKDGLAAMANQVQKLFYIKS